MSKSNNKLGKKFRRSLIRLRINSRGKKDKKPEQEGESLEEQITSHRGKDQRLSSRATQTDNSNTFNRFSVMSDPTNGFVNSSNKYMDEDDDSASVHSSTILGNGGHSSDLQVPRRLSGAESDVNGYFGLDNSSTRQSLGDSIMTGSSSFLSRNSTSSIYRSASHAFVNRQFVDALNAVDSLLTPETFANLGEPARIRAWNLYFAIVDTAFTQSESNGSSSAPTYPAQWTPEIRDSLVSQMRKGQTFTSVSEVYGGLKEIDIQVMVPLVVLSLRVSTSPALIQDKIEAYLAYFSQDFYDETYRTAYVKLIELYVLHVLPRQGEFNLGLAFVQENETLTGDEKTKLVHDIGETQIKIARDQQLEEEARKKSEEQEKEARRLRQHQEEERMLRKRANQAGGRLNSSISANSLASSIGPLPQQASNKQVSTRSHIASVLRWSYSSMWDRFRHSIFGYGGSTHNATVILQSLLGFVVFLLFWLSPSRARRRLRDGLGVVWGRLVDTISMGMKVTSL